MIDSPNFSHEKLLTVFIGVFNAESFLDSLFDQILNQDISDCSLVVVDNHSTDKTWERLQAWSEQLPIRLVRNHKNHGATGSLYLNMDLVFSPWLTFMHQDDVYLPNHLRTIASSLIDQDRDVVTISTDMGSITLEGRKFPSPPRASWLLPDDSLETNFLANLRLQAVPWPSTAFRTEVLLDVASAWHSSSFQDTEMMLHIAMIGKSRYLPIQTMLYRENPDSGSHELNLLEKQVGAGLALLRVFASDRFREFIFGISEGDRKFFARSVISGIRARLGVSEICQFVQLHAAEVMQFNWGYKVEELNQLVAFAYAEMGAERTVDLLRSLAREPNKGDSKLEWADLYCFEPRFSASKTPPSGNLKKWQTRGLRLLSMLPLKVKRLIFRSVATRLAGKSPSHPWNYKWR
jgi:glycosyltransferase involved in cell wall biosynthesis